MLQLAKRSWFSVSPRVKCGAQPTACVPQRPQADVQRTLRSQIFFTTCSYCAALIGIDEGARMVKNVIFDLGGVVIEWNPDRILAGYYADPELRAIMKTELFLHPDWVQLDRGTLNEADLLVRAAGRTGRSTAELGGLLDAVRSSLHTKTETV